MRASLPSVTVAVGVALASTCASYADVIYTSVSSSVIASYQFPTFGDQYTQSSNDLGHWLGGKGPLIAPKGNALANVSQASFIHPLHMEGTFFAQGLVHPIDSAPFVFAAAESRMSVQFTVVEATPFSFSMSWSTTGAGVWPSIAELPSVGLFHAGDMMEIVYVELEVSATGETLSDFITISGTLDPGDYLFDAAILAHAVSGTDYGSGYSEFSTTMQFQLSFIPAPGALALLGIMGLATNRRRRG